MARAVESRTLESLLSEAVQRIDRHSPEEALAAMRAGAPLIDIRSADNRERNGIVPGSVHIPRTVLEWRLAPDSRWRNPHVGDIEQPLILLCDHGYSTILAAATLVNLGYVHAGDVIGGFAEWREAGLPTIAAPQRQRGPDELAGMSPPDV